MKRYIGVVILLIVSSVIWVGWDRVGAQGERDSKHFPLTASDRVSPVVAGHPLEPAPRLVPDATFEKGRAHGLNAQPMTGHAGELIEVATSDDEDAQNPAVALCAGDQYLVVYEQDGEIYGQRLTNKGDLLGDAFRISDDSYSEASPTVACEWAYNLFVVAWEHDFNGTGTDFDIRYRGVYGSHQSSGLQFFTLRHDAANSENDNERDPDIVCNSFDHTCLVVYENDVNGNGDIYGQRLAVGSSDINREGGALSISGYTANEYNPRVAWGGLSDDFLVVWQYWYNDSYYRIVDRYLYDTFQNGDEFEQSAYFLLGKDEYKHDQQSPVVAYNYRAQQYLVIFQYDYQGDDSDHDVMGLRLTPPWVLREA